VSRRWRPAEGGGPDTFGMWTEAWYDANYSGDPRNQLSVFRYSDGWHTAPEEHDEDMRVGRTGPYPDAESAMAAATLLMSIGSPS
jgi:hypothetical protein